MKDALGASSASEHQCAEREEHTTLAAIHATDHQFRQPGLVLRVVPTTCSTVVDSRWWAFPLLQRFCREGNWFFDGHVYRRRLGKGIALRTLRVLLDAWLVVGRIERGRFGSLSR